MAKKGLGKKPPAEKQKMVMCTACKNHHPVPADQMAQHRTEVQRLGARQARSRAG